jgi:hypothetical protein
VAWVPAGLHDRNVHSVAAHVLDRVVGKSRTDSASLVIGVNANDVDPAHSIVKGVQSNRDEPDGTLLCDGDVNMAVSIGATGSDSFGLVGAPVWVQPEKHIVAKDLAKGREDRLPGTEGEVNDRLKVAVFELTDPDRPLAHVITVTPRRQQPGLRQRSGMTPEA